MNELLEYRKEMLAQERAGFFDYDIGETWFFYVPRESLWDDTIDLIRLEAHRLHAVLPEKMGSRAVISRSSPSGWHLIFPDASLTWEENAALLFYSRAHRGYVRYSLLLTDCTLRVGEKPGVAAPYQVEIIKWDDE